VALPKEHRLRRYQEFKQIYQEGSRHRGKWLILRVLQAVDPHPEPVAPTRIGISISQKVSKKAVVRNQIKRKIRAACRQLLPEISPGWKIVIVVRPGTQECEYSDFLQELRQLLAQTEVTNGHSRD
jgi:ribonuclease P protein component